MRFRDLIGSLKIRSGIRETSGADFFKTGRFDDIDLAVIISSIPKAVKNCNFQFCTALVNAYIAYTVQVFNLCCRNVQF